MNTIKIQVLRYLAGMAASAFDAGLHAVLAFMGVATVHAVSTTVPALGWKQMAAVFAVAFGKALVAYLKAHPVDVEKLAVAVVGSRLPVAKLDAAAESVVVRIADTAAGAGPLPAIVPAPAKGAAVPGEGEK